MPTVPMKTILEGQVSSRLVHDHSLCLPKMWGPLRQQISWLLLLLITPPSIVCLPLQNKPIAYTASQNAGAIPPDVLSITFQRICSELQLCLFAMLYQHDPTCIQHATNMYLDQWIFPQFLPHSIRGVFFYHPGFASNDKVTCGCLNG